MFEGRLHEAVRSGRQAGEAWMVRALEVVPSEPRSSPSQSGQYGGHWNSLITSGVETTITREDACHSSSRTKIYADGKRDGKAAAIPTSTTTTLIVNVSLSTLPFLLDDMRLYCSDEFACLIQAIEALHQIAQAQGTNQPFPMLCDFSSKCPSQHPNRLLLAFPPPS